MTSGILVNIGSGNGLSPVRYQVIIWNKDDLLSTESLRTNFSEIWSETQYFFQENALENVAC